MPCLPILSAVIFKALIIIALVPLSLPGVGYRPARRPSYSAATCSSTASFYRLSGWPIISNVTALSQLRVSEVLSIGVRVPKVVGYVHEHGIILRDLSAREHLITPDGQVKLNDFRDCLANPEARRVTLQPSI